MPINTLRHDLIYGEDSSNIDVQQCLDASHDDAEFNKWKVADAIRYLGNYDLDHNHHSGKIFHLFPCFKTLTKEETDELTLKDRYDGETAKYYWASEMLERKAWRHLRRQQRLKLLSTSQLSTTILSRGGNLEEHIHQLIETSGLEGTPRNLETDRTSVYFTASITSFFDKFDDIDDSAQYWRPTSRKHPACDGNIPDQG